jgi:hypothetical protein
VCGRSQAAISAEDWPLQAHLARLTPAASHHSIRTAAVPEFIKGGQTGGCVCILRVLLPPAQPQQGLRLQAMHCSLDML